ncbi:MAG: DHH family phosphoesterase [Clostridia bacterium]|nr:DHH family phosphoesterase [Clostridia bacterium]
MQNSNKRAFEIINSKTKIYLVIIAILLVVICCYEIAFIMPAVILYGLICFYALWTSNKRKSEISEHIQELTIGVDSAAKNTLINSPFPLIIVETDGNIIYKSSKFVSEFENVDIENVLNELMQETKIEIEERMADNDGNRTKDRTIQREQIIDNKNYKIIGEYVKSKNNERKKQTEYMLLLYFIDNTEYVKAVKKYNDAQICMGIIMIDNYEEMMQRIQTEDRPGVIAKIEKSIYDWAIESNGVVIKSDRDTFVYVFEQRYLEKIKENKFQILDEIKEIKLEGGLQITLSISISNEGATEYEKYKSALSGMDIVLGRGGDQAVIRENEKYLFFGGRAQEVEKRTKVKARTVAHALEELMIEAKDVMIMGHTNADIDSMGSSLGVYRIAKSLGKEVNIVNETNGLTINTFMDAIKKEEEEDIFIDKQEALSKISSDTLLIVVDTHKRSYVEVPELLERTNKIVVIDHHRRSTDYIDNATLTFQEVYASSAAELVTELLQYVETPISLKTIEVEGLYAGIMMDTKNFTFKTGVRTFEAAAFLRKCGVDIIKVKKWFQSDLESYNTISDIVKEAEVIRDTIAISIYEEDDKDASLICAKAADELLTISDITASFVIGTIGNKVCISGRSIGDINVQVILEKLGGGGHITLAGAQVEGKTKQEVKQELIKKIDEYFEELGN